jgi:hypothetical protein
LLSYFNLKIFLDKFPLIEKDPKTLIFNILSRLESRTDNIRQFAAPNNLLLLQSYKKIDIERELFISEEDNIDEKSIVNCTSIL